MPGWQLNITGKERCCGTTAWSVPALALLPGANVITVTAKDAAGNQSSDTITINYVPVVVSPKLSDLRKNDGGFSIGVPTELGHTYTLEFRNSFQELALRLNRAFLV